MPHMYASYVCLIYVCLICEPCLIYVCLICMPYMYALHVCLMCMPYNRIIGIRIPAGTRASQSHYRMCSLTIECVLLTGSLVYAYPRVLELAKVMLKTSDRCPNPQPYPKPSTPHPKPSTPKVRALVDFLCKGTMEDTFENGLYVYI